MSIEKQTPYGNIKVSDEVILDIVASEVKECYGVVGLADKNLSRFDTEEMLKPDSLKKGIAIKKVNNQYSIDVYIVCAYGTKVSEVLSEVQKRVKYAL
ncbi:MAG: Asp23/Gls24 family envelope stress response protein, partial [Bacilli bacterium]|nr:Asp23/Gls24 family envelope stress response protein [Bacilli bacterium]